MRLWRYVGSTLASAQQQPWKNYLADFRGLARPARFVAWWCPTRFDREPPPRGEPVARWPTRPRQGEWSRWAAAGWFRLAFRCGQRGGIGV